MDVKDEPRTKKVRRAEVDFLEAMDRIETKYALTYGEVLQILCTYISQMATQERKRFSKQYRAKRGEMRVLQDKLR